LLRELGISRTITVQHHHAHIAACMAEHQLDGSVIGVAWDGTGYGIEQTQTCSGTNSNTRTLLPEASYPESGFALNPSHHPSVWGGEFLLASRSRFTRLAHLRPVAMVGGDRSVRQPWRLALAYLRQALGENALPAARRLWPLLNPKHLDLVWTLLDRPSLSAPCTSAGRLFDAVAAILGLQPENEPVSFEGQPALRLESAAAVAIGDGTLRSFSEAGPLPYAFDLSSPPSPLLLDFAPMIASLVADREHGIGIESIAARVHATLAAAITATCQRLREGGAGERVCLGGGVFQNQILLTAVQRQLRASGFAVFVPQLAPMNDGGLSLGQAVVAQAQLATGNEQLATQLPCV
ncbi:MAG: hypothetical protein ACRD1F_08725, partial [Terriglobales bacterium]